MILMRVLMNFDRRKLFLCLSMGAQTGRWVVGRVRVGVAVRPGAVRGAVVICGALNRH